MVNLAECFEQAADPEQIQAVVVGYHYDDDDWDEPKRLFLVQTWEEARPVLDYEYHNGYGGADCHKVYAWTEARVLFVHEYDGATTVVWVPRNPVECAPDWGGSDV